MATEIFDVIRAGDEDRLRAILAADPNAASARNENGHSAVLIAQYHHRQRLVDLLLRAEPRLDLFDAASVGKIDRVRELLDEEPARVHAYSSDGFAPLHLAAFFGHPQLVELLLGRGADVSPVSRNPMKVQPLHSAVAGRHREVARLLIAAGADVHARQQGGWRPLHAAAQNGDLELTQLLLDRGADPRAQNDEGTSPVGLAAEKQHLDVLRALKAKRS